jgi:large subunit ribosomal protein L12
MEAKKMEYVYAALVLHKAGKEITESSIKKVLEAAGAHPDEARVRALVAALNGVNIDEAIKNAAPVGVATAPAAAHGGEKKEEKKEKKEEKKPEEAAAGLGALFG